MTPLMHARAQGVDDEELRQLMLRTALEVAVPLWIEVVRRMDPDERAEVAAECSAIIACGEKRDETRGRHGAGPALLAHGMPGKTRDVFNATAVGLAVMAFAPGGVNYLGSHWEASP